MSLLDLLQYRRSVRYYDPDKPLDSEKVRHCLQQATLSPSSSNMQLYEFYHITDKSTLQQLADAGYGDITTEVMPLIDTPAGTFYLAEAEHQQYLDKNPSGYCPRHSTGIPCN